MSPRGKHLDTKTRLQKAGKLCSTLGLKRGGREKKKRGDQIGLSTTHRGCSAKGGWLVKEV